ncbi:hypothetical protein [Sandaracinus amylolyticus]|uniref:Methyltransferase type 11 n=1 Tax=Sandaracinus amylolyticus TaxID=927083 RepID=A0A0F6YL28_9BACT|nr:hypothetical protein [Sandaracinus amylolyticus]AKF09382.1 Methyltransferase type 11 [Sandaracinus amylolyticus]
MDEELEEIIAAAHDALDDERPADARAMLEPAIARPGARDEVRAEALGLAAVAARAEGQERDARALSDRAIALASSSPELLADLLEDRAELELAARAPGSAASLLERAIALRASSGAETWLALGEARLRAGALDGADDALAHAEQGARDEEDDEGVALAIEMRADVALARPDAAAAGATYARAIDAWRALEDDAAIVRCLVGRARAAELDDDAGAVAAILRELEAIDGDVEGRAEAVDEVRALMP